MESRAAGIFSRAHIHKSQQACMQPHSKTVRHFNTLSDVSMLKNHLGVLAEMHIPLSSPQEIVIQQIWAGVQGSKLLTSTPGFEEPRSHLVTLRETSFCKPLMTRRTSSGRGGGWPKVAQLDSGRGVTQWLPSEQVCWLSLCLSGSPGPPAGKPGVEQPLCHCGLRRSEQTRINIPLATGFGSLPTQSSYCTDGQTEVPMAGNRDSCSRREQRSAFSVEHTSLSPV